MANVYMIDMRSEPGNNLYRKIDKLLNAAGIDKIVAENDLSAVKIHFGERGATAFIRPIYIRQIVDKLKSLGAKPFLADTNTLYVGSRGNAVDHHNTAAIHGFVPGVAGCPVIIADGLKGTNTEKVEINKKHFKAVEIAGDITNADVLIGVAHFKGHELTGIGGAIKNIGMGCASRSGKLAQHSGGTVNISEKRCVGCQKCISWCKFSALSMQGRKAMVDKSKCVGCGYCMLACNTKAIYNNWDSSPADVQEKMAEHALGVIKKAKKRLFINFVVDISPACDCYPATDVPIAGDVGILASTDMVALDQASTDLVNAQFDKGHDVFAHIHKSVNWRIQIEYGEKIDLGKSKYQLVKL